MKSTSHAPERILGRVDMRVGCCWLWTGRHDEDGYGRLGATPAHRLVYEMFMGAVPEGLELDHLCRVRGCVNPKHLEPVTHRENLMRGESWSAVNARKTHCPEGHPYDETNTYIDGKGRRRCRECARAYDLRRYYAGTHGRHKR